MLTKRAGLMWILLAGAGCAVEPQERPGEGSTVASRPAAAVAQPTACDRKMAATLLEEPVPGAPGFDARRSRILARAKARPVVFVRPPRAEVSREARALREQILSAPTSAYALYELYPRLMRRRALAREVLLTEGYLYAESPVLAQALANVVRLEHLFRAEQVWIHRGDEIRRAVRKKRNGAHYYVYADGPEAGARATILLLDRVSASREDLEDPLHRDLLPLARELGFDRMALRHLTARAAVVEFAYGDRWVPALLRTEGACVELACESMPPSVTEEVARARERARRLEAVLVRQRQIIQSQIEESLPFDEPKTEFGQQDGKLRQEWFWAYRYGRSHFDFNDDRYSVFDHQGRPRVPQVCIDFITDTFERLSGSWYRHRGEPRSRLPGRFDFSDHAIENQRSVDSFVEFAESHPDWFEVWHLPEDERIPLIQRQRFYSYLHSHRDRFRPGDVVTILGLRDDDKLHYHSFFIYEADPVTGMPTLVAANAGRPRIRSWDNEMVNAPLRSIKTRIRPRLSWLESIVQELPRATGGGALGGVAAVEPARGQLRSRP